MDNTAEYLEQLWSDLLSHQPELIQAAFDALDSASQKIVFSHLQCMANEPGWQPEQRDSALAALRALNNRQTRKNNGYY
jgi:hypothetical protein